MSENEKRLRDLIRNAEPTTGTAFAHWFPNGWFLLFSKDQVKLFHSLTCSSKPSESRLILTEKRNAKGYAYIATAMGL